MSRFLAHLETSCKLIAQYKGDKPFAVYLKAYFAANKKHGSNDRRLISALCYGHFRTANLLKNLPLQEATTKGYFLTNCTPNPFLQNIAPELNDHVGLPLPDKLTLLNCNLENISKFHQEFSKLIDVVAYEKSLLVQPDVFLRIRPEQHKTVFKKLRNKEIPYEKITEDTLQFAANVKLEEALQLNREAVIQDIASQNVLTYLTNHLSKIKFKNLWDCCAASGGKTILLYDVLPKGINIFVSDIRESILANHKKRMKEASIPIAKTFDCDLEKTFPDEMTSKFDLIIADVPCSGSGTWARSPEQLQFFNEAQLDLYVQKQMAICDNAIKGLKPEGHFIYITCSVFEAENEANVDALVHKHQLKLLHQQYYQYNNLKGDTLFATCLQKV